MPAFIFMLEAFRVISFDIIKHSLLPQVTTMSSLATSAGTVSSSDWILLSEFLCPNYSSIHNVQIDPIKDETKGTIDTWTSCDDGPEPPVFSTDEGVHGNELIFKDVDDDIAGDDDVFETIHL